MIVLLSEAMIPETYCQIFDSCLSRKYPPQDLISTEAFAVVLSGSHVPGTLIRLTPLPLHNRRSNLFFGN